MIVDADHEIAECPYFRSVVEASGGLVVAGGIKRLTPATGRKNTRPRPNAPSVTDGNIVRIGELAGHEDPSLLSASDDCDPADALPVKYRSEIHRVGNAVGRYLRWFGVIYVNGIPYRSAFTRDLAVELGARECATYTNPWDESAVYVLSRQDGKFKEVPRMTHPHELNGEAITRRRRQSSIDAWKARH